MACLDTTVFIDLGGKAGHKFRDRATSALRDLINSDEELTTTRFNLAELYVGVARSTKPQGELERIEHWLADVRILEFDDRAARIFGELVGSLLGSRRQIGDMDALIASVAIVNDESLVTRNPRHFAPVPGLRVYEY